MSLEQQISKGIMEAMKAKDTVRLSALRNAKKYIIEAKTAGPEIAELPDADVLKIISKLAKQGTDSAAIFTEQNRADLASEELAQVAVFIIVYKAILKLVLLLVMISKIQIQE